MTSPADTIREANRHIIEGVGVLIPGAETKHDDENCPGCIIAAALTELEQREATLLRNIKDEAVQTIRAKQYGAEQFARAEAAEADRDRWRNFAAGQVKRAEEAEADRDLARASRDDWERQAKGRGVVQHELLARAERAEADRDRASEARDNWHVAYMREREKAHKAEADRDRLTLGLNEWAKTARDAEADRDRWQQAYETANSNMVDLGERWERKHAQAEADRDRLRAEWQREAERDHAAFAELAEVNKAGRASETQLLEENVRLADTLREMTDALTETLQHPDHVSDEVRKERNRHALDLVARAALDRPSTPPTSPGDVPAAPEGTCNGCDWGWERYVNPNGIYLHRNESDTLGAVCTNPPADRHTKDTP